MVILSYLKDQEQELKYSEKQKKPKPPVIVRESSTHSSSANSNPIKAMLKETGHMQTQRAREKQ